MGILLFVCLFVCGVVNCHFLCFIQNLHFQTVTLNTASARAVVLSVQNEIGVSYLMDILLDNCKSSKFYFNLKILTIIYKFQLAQLQEWPAGILPPESIEVAGKIRRLKWNEMIIVAIVIDWWKWINESGSLHITILCIFVSVNGALIRYVGRLYY